MHQMHFGWKNRAHIVFEFGKSNYMNEQETKIKLNTNSASVLGEK